MADITVAVRPDGAFDVEVHDQQVTTHHLVTVPSDLADELGIADTEAERARLVHLSFEFLLEREPAASILRRFDLDVITGYFPAYPADIARRLSR
jgi:hypothetical protein